LERWQEGANEQLFEEGKSDKGRTFKPLPREQDRSSQTEVRECDRKRRRLEEAIAREAREYANRREELENKLAEMEQEVEKDRQIQRTAGRKRSSAEAFQDDMSTRNATEEYLVKEGNRPSEDEPINLTLTEEEWLTRLVRHRGVESQTTAIKYELMELGQEEEDARTWLLRHNNERWYRGNGEWDYLSYSVQQRIYWIGSEQRAARSRIAALDAQMIAMAVFEDTQKMADQAEAAAEALNGRFIGPRLGKPAQPPLPYHPPMCRWSGLLYYNGKQVSYEEYMQDYQESLARDITYHRRVQDNDEERLHRDTVANLGSPLRAHLEENERHENEVEEIYRRAP
jgi:hypothetical protein